MVLPVSGPAGRDRYLDILGVTGREPSVAALAEIVQAHLWRVPFENISKLYCRERPHRRGLPGPGRFLDGIEQYRFGGTCYATNYYLHELLASLGYSVTLCGADMSRPDVHLVNMVKVEGREFLVDVGYAAPFTAPLPRDLHTEHEIGLGGDLYVLRPQDADGCSSMELYQDGRLTHGYVAKPAPRRIEEFEGVISASFHDDATFMNSILLARFSPARSVVIRNMSVTEFRGVRATTEVASGMDGLARAITAHFGMPGSIVHDALSRVGDLGDAWNGGPAPGVDA